MRGAPFPCRLRRTLKTYSKGAPFYIASANCPFEVILYSSGNALLRHVNYWLYKEGLQLKFLPKIFNN